MTTNTDGLNFIKIVCNEIIEATKQALEEEARYKEVESNMSIATATALNEDKIKINEQFLELKARLQNAMNCIDTLHKAYVTSNDRMIELKGDTKGAFETQKKMEIFNENINDDTIQTIREREMRNENEQVTTAGDGEQEMEEDETEYMDDYFPYFNANSNNDKQIGREYVNGKLQQILLTSDDIDVDLLKRSEEEKKKVQQLKDEFFSFKFKTINLRKQMYAFIYYVNEHMEKELGYYEFAQMCKQPRAKCGKQWSYMFNAMISQKGNSGRPQLMSDSIRKKIFEKLKSQYLAKNPLTYPQLKEVVKEYLGNEVNYEYLYKMVSESQQFTSIIASPMENNRVEVDEKDIRIYFQILDEYAKNIPVGFIFNCDETGIQRWSDRIKQTVIVPVDYRKENVAIPVKRNEKRITMVACVAMDGTYLVPMVLTHRISIPKTIHEMGLTDSTVRFFSTENGFMNKMAFDTWVKEVFLQELKIRREKTGYRGISVLIMDAFGSHLTPETLRELGRNGVKVILMPPHSSHLLQVLDVGIFGLFKKELARVYLGCESESEFLLQVLRMVRAWQKIATWENITSAFKQCGMTHIRDKNDVIKVFVW